MEKPSAVSVNCLQQTYSAVETGLHNTGVGRCTTTQLKHCSALLSECVWACRSHLTSEEIR